MSNYPKVKNTVSVFILPERDTFLKLPKSTEFSFESKMVSIDLGSGDHKRVIEIHKNDFLKLCEIAKLHWSLDESLH